MAIARKAAHIIKLAGKSITGPIYTRGIPTHDLPTNQQTRKEDQLHLAEKIECAVAALARDEKMANSARRHRPRSFRKFSMGV